VLPTEIWPVTLHNGATQKESSTFMDVIPEGKRPLGRPRRRGEHNIKMNLQEVGCRSMEWIELAQDRGRWRTIVNEVMNIRVL
jgi:hypothetical protein